MVVFDVYQRRSIVSILVAARQASRDEADHEVAISSSGLRTLACKNY